MDHHPSVIYERPKVASPGARREAARADTNQIKARSPRLKAEERVRRSLTRAEPLPHPREDFNFFKKIDLSSPLRPARGAASEGPRLAKRAEEVQPA